MQNDWINRIDSRTIKRDQLGWLDVSKCHLDHILHALHLNEWRFQKVKRFC
jgi:hypothetical protein